MGNFFKMSQEKRILLTWFFIVAVAYLMVLVVPGCTATPAHAGGNTLTGETISNGNFRVHVIDDNVRGVTCYTKDLYWNTPISCVKTDVGLDKVKDADRAFKEQEEWLKALGDLGKTWKPKSQ